MARPPVATKRLSRLEGRRLLYRLKRRWRDGTTHVVFEPQELMEKLAALVPPPRFHLVRYHGILGPCASARDRVVPGAPTPAHRDGSAALPYSVAWPDAASKPNRWQGLPRSAGAPRKTVPPSPNAGVSRRPSNA